MLGAAEGARGDLGPLISREFVRGGLSASGSHQSLRRCEDWARPVRSSGVSIFPFFS